MIARVVIGCVALCMLAFPLAADEPPKPKETKLKPTLVFSGTHSAIQKEQYEVITDEAAWKRMWEAHRGKEADPPFTEQHQEFAIDFHTHYIVAVFAGGCDWIEITPRLRSEAVVIGYKGWLNQVGVGGPDLRSPHQKAKDSASAPYAFVVLPKPVKTVVIEEDIRSRIEGDPEWKERKRFAAAKDKK